MGLISYDLKSSFSNGRYGEKEKDFFSKQTKGVNLYMGKNHVTKAISAVLSAIKQVMNDPSSISDTVLYKGREKTKSISLDTLMNHSSI